MPIIEVRDVVKQFGPITALGGVSFNVEKGEVLGFLGPNGAGKTTALRIITGYYTPTAGQVVIDGEDVAAAGKTIRRKLGYLPENAPLYAEMRVEEYLRFRGALKGLKRGELGPRLDFVCDRCQIGDVRHQIIGTLSRGYRQRVGIADALIADPPVLILDEPTVGLDPNQIREVRELIRELGRNHTILFSTHILPEVEAVCQRVVIIHKGRIVAEGKPRELEAQLKGGRRLVLVVQNPPADAEATLRQLAGIAAVQRAPLDGNKVRFTLELAGEAVGTEQLFALAAGRGWRVGELREERTSLEEIFAQLTVAGGAESAPAAAEAAR